MSAQVTEKHIDLVRCVLDAEWWGGNVEKRFAQIIADSEAKAVSAVNASLDAAIIRTWGISAERDQLRTERNNLRADLDAIKAIRDEETARAERAEAELAKAKAILASIEEDGTEEHNAAVSLRRELATERDIVSRIWVQLGSPTYEQLKGRSIYDLIDEMRAELATEREKAERYRLASLKLDAELAAERAKVRLLHSALQNLADEQNGAPLERRREEWQEAMDEACAALAATEETK